MMKIRQMFSLFVAAVCLAVFSTPRAQAQCVTNQLDHDFDLGVTEVLLNRLLVDAQTQQSLWDNGQGGGLWQNIPGQQGPGFNGVDNSGNGIDDDDHLDLLAAIINGDASVVGALNPATVTQIRNAYNANKAYLQTREITIRNVRAQALFLNLNLTVTTGGSVSIPIVGATEIPSLWGINEADPNDGLLSSADPNLERILLNLGTGYMTIGDPSDVNYLQAFIAQITLAVIEFVLPELLNNLKSALNVSPDAPVEIVAYQFPSAVELIQGSDKAFAVNCGPISPVALTVVLEGISVNIQIAKQDICNALQEFVDQFQCGTGSSGFQCLTSLLAASGNLNGDGATNLQSYNASANRQAFLEAESIANPPLEIISAPSDTTVTAGGSFSLGAQVTGGQNGGVVAYNWDLVNPESFARLGVITTDETYARDYALPVDSIPALGVAVCDGLWARRTLPIALNVTPTAFAIIEQPEGLLNSIPGDAHTLSVKVQGGTAVPTYQWQFDNGVDGFLDIDGATERTYTIDPLDLDDTGDYRCLISGENNGSPTVLTSDAAFIEVEDRIRFTTQPVGGGIYVEEDFTFTVEIAGTPDGTLGIQWTRNGEDIDGANSTTLEITNATLNDNGTYVCVLTDDTHVVPSNPVVLVVAEHLSITADPEGGTYFEGTLVSLDVETNGGLGTLHYQWFKNGEELDGAADSPSLVFDPILLSDGGSYSVTVSDDFESVASGSTTLVVLPPFEITTQPVGSIRFEGPGSHTFEIDVEGGEPPFSFQWLKNGQNFGPPRDMANRNLTISGDLTVADSGSFRCRVSDVNGAKLSNIAVLDIRTQLRIDQQPQDKSVYIGGSTTLSAQYSGGIGEKSFRWKRGAITVSTNEVLTISNAQLFLAGQYTFTVKVGDVEVTSDPATLFVGEPIEITQHPQHAWRFLGDEVTLSVAHIKGAGPIRYEWFHNGEPIEDSDSSSLNITGLTDLDGGEYYVIVSDGVTGYQSNSALLTMVTPLFASGAEVNVSLDTQQMVPQPQGLLASGLATGTFAPAGPLTNGIAENYLMAVSLVHTPLAGVLGAEQRLGAPGANGPLVKDLGVPLNSTLSIFKLFSSAEAAEMVAGVHYIVVNTAALPSGAIRGQVVLTPLPEGEGEPEGIAEGEGEGVVEGEGEGVVEGEPEGVVEGEPEGVVEGEEDLSPIAAALLQAFTAGDLNGDGYLDTSELTALAGEFTPEQLAGFDANSDGKLQPSELLAITGPMWLHNADVNGDKVVSLSELLRALQIYNQGGYSCAANAGATEDGFIASASGGTNCQPHATDYTGENPDYAFSLVELLRLIQVYNAGGYSWCPDVEPRDDGYCIVLKKR